MKKIKYGIVETGHMAKGHLGCINEIDDIEIVAAAEESARNGSKPVEF